MKLVKTHIDVSMSIYVYKFIHICKDTNSSSFMQMSVHMIELYMHIYNICYFYYMLYICIYSYIFMYLNGKKIYSVLIFFSVISTDFPFSPKYSVLKLFISRVYISGVSASFDKI